MILAIDPGKEKCGLAVLNPEGKVLAANIVTRLDIAKTVLNFLSQYSIQNIIIGHSASGREVEKEISRLDLKANLIYVSEFNSTVEARRRYWQEHTPKGLWRLIPTSFRYPPVPIDDYAAIILGERYLKG